MTKQPLWLTDYVVPLPTKKLHSMANYLLYNQLSSPHRAYLWVFSTISEPTSFYEACKDGRWIEEIQAEIAALQANKTWELVCLPLGKTRIGCSWVYKVKLKIDREIKIYKARLVAKDCSQKDLIIIKHSLMSLRMLLLGQYFHEQLCRNGISNRWINGFLQGDLDDEVYMELPHGFSSRGRQLIDLS